MTWQIISLADVPPSPWKNGGGTTRELVAWPNAQDWLWRMSVAEVTQSGPFSRFEGVRRWFAVLSGAGVRLDIGHRPHDASHRLTSASEPLSFAGDDPVQCTLLDGATQDFNLMLRANRANAFMARVNGKFSSQPSTTQIIATYALGSGVTVNFDDEYLVVPPNALAWRLCPAGTPVEIKAESALWMEIDP